MSKPIDVRFWEQELKNLLDLLHQSIKNDINFLVGHMENPETEEFCTALSVLDDRRNLYAKLSESLTQNAESKQYIGRRECKD